MEYSNILILIIFLCLCYFIDREKENSTEQPTLQDNAMIIKLQDGDVLTAQEDADYEGIIHIPDTIWNHIIQETEHSDQEWVNSLYLDVNDLEIGGSGLPIVISSFRIGARNSSINTYDMLHKPYGQSATVTIPNNRFILYITIATNQYEIHFMYNKTGADQTRSFTQFSEDYYYVTNTPLGDNSPICYLYSDNGDLVFTFSDNYDNDTRYVYFYLNKQLFDFLWLTP